MTRANVAEVKSRLSYYLRLATSGEQVIICDRNRPIAELVPVSPPVDLKLRESAFGMFSKVMTDEQLDEAMRPMTDEEADAFIEGRY